MILPHSKLIHVGLPHENGTLVKQLLDHSRTERWDIVCSKTTERHHDWIVKQEHFIPAPADLLASWMHMWSGCLLCRNCP